MTTGEPGDLVPVGSTLIVFEVAAGAKPAVVKPAVVAEAAAAPQRRRYLRARRSREVSQARGRESARTGHDDTHAVLTSPSIRRRAREAGIDLTEIHGSGRRRPHHASRFRRARGEAAR